METEDPITAVLAADIHLSSRPPIARCDDWWTVQKRYLRQLYESTPSWDTPIVIAGDVFDNWNATPELLNFAIDNLPGCYAICGNHELPCHSLKDIEKSAFWTMVKVGRIKYLRPGIPELVHEHKLALYGFPYGTPLAPLPDTAPKGNEWTHLAVVHAYCWKDGHCHPGAKKEHHVSACRKQLKGYTAAVFGDNHSGFLSAPEGKMPILNCGTLIRRRSDEVDYVPKIGLLHKSGKITRKALDTHRDRFHDVKKIAKTLGVGDDNTFGFVEELNGLEDVGFDFRSILLRKMEQDKVAPSVRGAVLAILEKV